GVANQAQGPTMELPYTVVQDIVLSAAQTLNISTPIGNDADFALRAICINLYSSVFMIRLASSSNYFLSDGLIHSNNIGYDPSAPFPITPELVIPAGGRINIEVLNLDQANPNTIQI